MWLNELLYHLFMKLRIVRCAEDTMGSCKLPFSVLLLFFFIGNFVLSRCLAVGVATNQTAQLLVNASESSGRPIPSTLFGIFFEVSLVDMQLWTSPSILIGSLLLIVPIFFFFLIFLGFILNSWFVSYVQPILNENSSAKVWNFMQNLINRTAHSSCDFTLIKYP